MSCLGTGEGEGESCEDCEGLCTSEVPLIEGLQEILAVLDELDRVGNKVFVTPEGKRSLKLEVEAYLAAYTVACLEWEPMRHLVPMLTFGCWPDTWTCTLQMKPTIGANGKTLHEAVVRATWAVVQEVTYDN